MQSAKFVKMASTQDPRDLLPNHYLYGQSFVGVYRTSCVSYRGMASGEPTTRHIYHAQQSSKVALCTYIRLTASS